MERNNRDLRHRFGGAHGAESTPETWYRAEEVLVNDQICLGLNLLDETSWFRVVEVVKTAHGVWLNVGIGDYRQRVFRQAGENLKVRRTRSHVAA